MTTYTIHITNVSKRKPIDLGSLRHRLVVQVNTPTTDSGGGLVDSWATSTTIWGLIQTRSEFEAERGGAAHLAGTHVLKTRYNSALTADKRLTWEGDEFDISGVVDLNYGHHSMIVDLTRRDV